MDSVIFWYMMLGRLLEQRIGVKQGKDTVDVEVISVREDGAVQVARATFRICLVEQPL